jgi:hypothetical protein
MEELGYYYGFVVYRTAISAQGAVTLAVPGVRDRGIVYCDRVRIIPYHNYTLQQNKPLHTIPCHQTAIPNYTIPFHTIQQSRN